jgi:hypothetical protein
MFANMNRCQLNTSSLLLFGTAAAAASLAYHNDFMIILIHHAASLLTVWVGSEAGRVKLLLQPKIRDLQKVQHSHSHVRFGGGTATTKLSEVEPQGLLYNVWIKWGMNGWPIVCARDFA